jgi:uncharacterized protein
MSPTDTTAVADRILDRYRTWAVVGASPNPTRPSHGVIAVLERHGYEVVPVRPDGAEVRGQRSYPDLASLPAVPEVVDIFRRSSRAGAHVDEAIAVGAKAVWLQLGVIDEDAAERARAAGLDVVMDRCPAIELSRRGGRALTGAR